MEWDGHEFDADIETSKVDRGYTKYADEFYLMKSKNKLRTVKCRVDVLATSTLIF